MTISSHRPFAPSRANVPISFGSISFSMLIGCCALSMFGASSPARADDRNAVVVGDERAVIRHLQDGEEYNLPTHSLIQHGRTLFEALWTAEDGAGRPLTKGTGAPLTDPSDPLVFPRNANRISAPDSNGCVSCHNRPFTGGGGDFVANAFVPAQRFDFVTFNPLDPIPTRGGVNEIGVPVTLQSIGNSRNAIGEFGSGFIEMLARQMTAELQSIRNSILAGGSRTLATKGVSFGILSRRTDGSWDISRVEGLPAPSLLTSGTSPPSLIILPFHHSGTVVSLRQFTNNAFNHHHGIQSTERFGSNTDPDGDGFVNELTRADVTATSIFQATLPVPGRVIPNNPTIEAAVWVGEKRFAAVGCAGCHVPSLPLTNNGWVYSEPNPYNPAGNLRVGDAPTLTVDLTNNALPPPRLAVTRGVVYVPAFTDLKLHDITSGPDDPNRDPIDMNEPAGSPKFLGGNSRFLTRKLWGDASEPPFFHHGKFTTFREAILAHAGEALASRRMFEALNPYEQGAIIEFLKTLKVLPPGTRSLVVDENGNPKNWPR
jgi:hypothetical protein